MEFSRETKEDKTELLAKQARIERDNLLFKSDFAVLPDSPVSSVEAWKNYRTKLRDIPNQIGFPINIEWPLKPIS